MNQFINGGYILEVNIVKQSEFIYIEKIVIPNRKTAIYWIHSKKDANIILGEIKWFGAWRKYCFFPGENTIFDNKCLNFILEFLEEVNGKK